MPIECFRFIVARRRAGLVTLALTLLCAATQLAQAQAEPAPAAPVPAPAAAAPAPAAAPTVEAAPTAKPVASAAQTVDAPATGPHAAALDALSATKAERSALDARLGETEGDAREPLAAQIADVSARYRRGLVELAEQIGESAQAADSEATQANKAELLRRLNAEEARIDSDLDASRAALDELATKLDQASAEERGKLSTARAALLTAAPVLLSQLGDNVKARRQLGDDVGAALAAWKTRLNERAQRISTVLHGTVAELQKLDAAIEGKGTDAQQAQRTELVELRGLVATLQRKQLELMDALKLDTAQYRQELIRATGEMSQDILNAEVATGLVATWKDDAFNWLRENGAAIVFKAISFALVLFVFAFLARTARWFAQRAVRNTRQMSSLAGDFFVKSVGRAVMFAGWVVAAAQIGIEVAPLLAGLGIAGFVLGFALQDTLSNFASGMMILVYRPFDVGDAIEAAGVSGKVHAMNLVSTAIVTFDNQMLLVPNTKIWGDVIRNITHQPNRRVDLTFGIGYADDIDQAQRVLEDIIAKNERVLSEPASVVRLHELADSSVNFVVRPWVKTEDYWDAYWEITREVKVRFDAEGISIPFPQRDVHVYEERLAARDARPSGISRTAEAE